MIAAVALVWAAVSADSLSLAEVLAQVRAHHPAARQAALARRQVEADLRAARGGFDPYVSATWDFKRFKGIGYYDEIDTRLVVPTPWGVDLKLGWERAAGAIINPERATPGAGLLSAGVSLPIGPRLIADERRTALRQAELAADAAEAEYDAALARLLQQAAREWGTWYDAEARLRIAREGIALARFRLDAVRARVAAGDAAPIDSLEARAEWERRVLAEADARAAATAARLAVAALLWDERGTPVPLPEGTVPAAGEVAALGATVEAAAQEASASPEAIARMARAHPQTQQARARWLQAEAARRLALVQVLPSASAEISALAAGRSLGGLPSPAALDDDSKVSGSVRIPLFARRELGRLRAAEARAGQLATERDKVEREVALAVERAVTELRAVEAQRDGQQRVLAASEALLAAEQRRFEIGESSLLFVNLRERAVLDERLRVAQLAGRRAASLGALAVALGRPQILADETRPRSSR